MTDYSVEMNATAITAGSATVVVTSYPKALLDISKDLIDQERFNIAIVTSHMACEVAAERAFDAAYSAKNLEQLGEAVDRLMNGHNLGNERHLNLYNVLTGTQIEKEPFWSRFKAASEKRNAIVHKSAQANKKDAEDALLAAIALITHLNQL